MSNSYNMHNVLDIQDKNIIFSEDCVEYTELKGIKSKIIKATLTYLPSHCDSCGVVNEDYTIQKHGFKSSRITLPSTGIYPTYLKLKKQRFFCKACNSTFSAKTNLVDQHCFISKQTKMSVLIKSAEARSMTDIAKDCSVSTPTVQRVINEAAENYKPHYRMLPKHLSFDEFKYQKGTMAFEYVNAETGDILDILSARDSRTIKNHFISNYTSQHLKNVETITIDMNAGYVNVIKEIFPQAKVIIDRFHLVQLVNRSMNITRVRVMNNFKTSNGEDMKKYRRLKRYWKLILKKQTDLSYTEYKFYYMFGQTLETTVVDEMLTYSENLKVNYDFYQNILHAIKEKNFHRLEDILSKVKVNSLSSKMKTSVKTLLKHLPYIENSLKYPFNNGRIEGINNKIKVLNRIAYGYRNFQNYKNRILLHFKLRANLKQTESEYLAA